MQISTHLYLKYRVDADSAAAAARLLRHVVVEKGLAHLLRDKGEL